MQIGTTLSQAFSINFVAQPKHSAFNSIIMAVLQFVVLLAFVCKVSAEFEAVNIAFYYG